MAGDAHLPLEGESEGAHQPLLKHMALEEGQPLEHRLALLVRHLAAQRHVERREDGRFIEGPLVGEA